MKRVAETKLWYAADLDAELLRARFGDFTYEQHTHDTACLALITGGAIRIRMKGAELIARAGDLYAIDPEEPHAGWPVDGEGWSQRTIYADLAALGERLAEDEGAPGLPALRGPIIRDAALASAFMAAHRQCEAGGSRLARDERYLGFARRLFTHHLKKGVQLKPSRESRAVRRAREFLDSRLDANVSLAEVASAGGLSPFRIYRAFERETGMTPHAYQRQARVRAALDLIRRGEPLAEVATAAGFSDQAHLTRSFRARLGVTPGAYREARLSAA